CIIVNYLILQYVGSIGISAFAAVNSVMAIFWPVIFGMVAVTRMLLSITIGEEDRQSLAEIMRVLFKHGMLLCFGIVALIILMAVPFTNMFYQEPAETVYSLTVQGFRILPLCMPLAVLSLGFVAYTQAMENKFLSNVIPVVDGAVGVVSFSFILIPLMKLTGLYISNILNGVVCGLIILGYSIVRNRHFPKNIEEFLVIPDDFGVPKEERLDLEIHNLEEVTKVSEQIIDFSSKHNVDHRRANLSGLALEEMAINILKHGFAISPGRDHQIIIRVVHKDDYIILRILDNCTEFDPFKRITNDNDIADIYHTGIRIAYSTAKDVQYQNLLGLNVLTFSI
nr:hypothetical protein [Lachnospiraceae bacterium]